MDYTLVLFWLVSLSCLAGLVVTWMRMRFTVPGWMAVYLAVFLLSLAGWLSKQPAITNAAAAIWFVLILLPGLIVKVYNQRILQQKYAAACRLARIISWLHPADGCRELPAIVHALDLAQQGQLAAASQTLNRFQKVESPVGLSAIMNLFRIMNQWEEFLAWQSRHPQIVARHPQFLPILLRTLGEVGDVRGMVELYHRHQEQIRKLVPASQRDTCRLMLFAFCGKREAVESLCAGPLAALSAPTRAFWLATADLAAGATESATRQFEELLPVADGLLRGAIERRLSRIAIRPEPLDATAERIVAEATTEHAHEERFDARRSLFSAAARATQIFIALNVFMFLVEMCLGGGTDLDVLCRLGALFPPAVQAGQWWRLLSAIFLHYGALHLAMNMLGLWYLGPFVEFALGFRRFVLVYLLAGVGSMATVFALSSGISAADLTVGASGCIMGLVGATAALMLRGWLRENARAAKRRLVLMLSIVVAEVLFDSMVPQISMTAHLSGTLIGFAATMLVRDRLRPPATQQLARRS
jgi:rhomboid protease GluP